MKAWQDERITTLLGIDTPLIQAPMAGADTPELAAAVSKAGGLGSLGCAFLTPGQIKQAWEIIRQKTTKPVNLNFFCHEQQPESAAQQAAWKKQLAPYYAELGLDIDTQVSTPSRVPFNESFCEVIETLKPEVVSFHFGLPAPPLVERVKKTGAIVFSTATTVDEAKWLVANGCDVVIAQGAEAGGHRGMFLTKDVSTQVGTMALLPQIVDAVSVPVIAAGGIADARGIRAAFSLGASAVQMGTVYLFCPEAKVSAVHRQVLNSSHETAITNIYSGKPARGIVNRFMRSEGPLSPHAPDFPYASRLVMPLRTKSETLGKTDFVQMWAGQAAHLGREMPAGALTKTLAEEAAQP